MRTCVPRAPVRNAVAGVPAPVRAAGEVAARIEHVGGLIHK